MQSLKRRKLLEAIAAGFGASLLASCGCGSDSGPVPNPPPPPPPRSDCWVVYPDPCDPRILALVPANGGRFSLVGTKSPSGNIECAHRLLVIDAAESLSTVEFIPEENKLIGTAGGARISVCPVNDGNWAISLLAGNEQLETCVTPIPGDIPVGQQSGTPRAGRHVQLDLQQRGCAACAGQSTTVATSAAMADIAVTGCIGINSQAFVYLRDETGKLLDVATAGMTADNRFTGFPGDGNTPADAASEAASKARAFVQSFDSVEAAFVCVLSQLKSTSAMALSNGIIAALKSQNRFSAVYDQFGAWIGGANAGISDEEKMARAAAFFAKMLGTVYLAVEFHDRLNQAAGSNLADAYSEYKLRALELQPALTAEDGTQFTGPATAPLAPQGPFPLLTLDTGRAASVSRLALNPALPAVGEDYVVAGVLACLEPGDTVTATVAGTDGYTDSVFAVVGAQGNADLALGVPGSPAGLRDVITITVQRAGAEIARRSALLALG